ncbi:hypothetical protein ACQE3E_22320 [Methylomonas sp. MED-D]|uniref:hypothetical protein n=1 Tax=unclassified Methylomonas TaxID=2608980 RepID=UPI0028A4644C|nr:hypothetical protein [Methylomonas sp. MV1]MDT4332896.1 hypothetical protein [Methylomonas sp. MV1]
MEYSELEKLIGRADRFRKRLHEKQGDGTGWPFTLENGETHYISIHGVKSPEELEDDISSMFIWLWNLKDYVKKYVVKRGKSKDWVENKVNADPYLCICADLANALKHGGLDQNPRFTSRSGKSPQLGVLRYQVPQKAIGSLCIGAYDLNVMVTNPKFVNLEMIVLGEDGKKLGDAFKYLEYALKAWEKIVSGAGKVV